MDETKSRWFRLIADHAHQFFWGVWGAGLGAFGMVITNAVDMRGITAPTYLAVLTVLMGGALGLVSSRAMDHLADDRRRRRKLLTAMARMRRTRGIAKRLKNDVFEAAALIAQGRDAGDTINRMVLRAFRLYGASTVAPDLDDVINDIKDVEQAARLADINGHLQDWFKLIGAPECLTSSKRFRETAEHLSRYNLERFIEVFDEVEAHFAIQFTD